MREWLEYHLMLGVQYFFLFPNDCNKSSATRQLLAPYQKASVVTIDSEFDCARAPFQAQAYRRSIARYGSRTQWMAFIDLDEFIILKAPSEKSRRLASIPEFFGALNGTRAVDAWPAVALPWRLFGTSGHEARPKGPVIVEYYKRASTKAKDWRARSYKSVANMAACKAATVHVCTEFAPGWEAGLFTVSGGQVTLGRSTLRAAQLKFSKIFLAHYRTRSLDDWNSRHERGDAGAMSHAQAAKGPMPSEYNEVIDRTIPQNVETRIRQCALATSMMPGASEAIRGLRGVLLGEDESPRPSDNFPTGACFSCWLHSAGPVCGGAGWKHHRMQ